MSQVTTISIAYQSSLERAKMAAKKCHLRKKKIKKRKVSLLRNRWSKIWTNRISVLVKVLVIRNELSLMTKFSITELQ